MRFFKKIKNFFSDILLKIKNYFCEKKQKKEDFLKIKKGRLMVDYPEISGLGRERITRVGEGRIIEVELGEKTIAIASLVSSGIVYTTTKEHLTKEDVIELVDGQIERMSERLGMTYGEIEEMLDEYAKDGSLQVSTLFNSTVYINFLKDRLEKKRRESEE